MHNTTSSVSPKLVGIKERERERQNVYKSVSLLSVNNFCERSCRNKNKLNKKGGFAKVVPN